MNETVILVPRLYNPGGVASYYSAIKPYLGTQFQYVYRGKAVGKNKITRFITDYIHYYKTVKHLKKEDAVIINSSLGSGSIYRDGLYSLLTPQRVKKIVFIRGWDGKFENSIENSFFLKKWLNKTFLQAHQIIVLSSEFKDKLAQWGYGGRVAVETTLVDEDLVEGFDIRKKSYQKNEILFLSRVEYDKGVFEAADAVEMLSDRFKTIQLTIAGNGTAFEDIKRYTANKNGAEIELKGYVQGEEKLKCFQSALMFIFPSIHGEGMPNAVLEAMAFGLPVITTRVGGIPDFFEDGKMGLFLDNREPEHIAEKIQYLLERPKLMKKISHYNYEYAKEHFYAGKVAERLKKIISDLNE